MELSLLVWLLPTLALVIGVVVGFVVARLLPNAAPSSTQRQLDDIQKRFDSYQNEVVTHFNSTAVLVLTYTLGGLAASSFSGALIDWSPTLGFPLVLIGVAAVGLAVLLRTRHRQNI